MKFEIDFVESYDRESLIRELQRIAAALGKNSSPIAISISMDAFVPSRSPRASVPSVSRSKPRD
jgi:hypothetical protein